MATRMTTMAHRGPPRRRGKRGDKRRQWTQDVKRWVTGDLWKNGDGVPPGLYIWILTGRDDYVFRCKVCGSTVDPMVGDTRCPLGHDPQYDPGKARREREYQEACKAWQWGCGQHGLPYWEKICTAMGDPSGFCQGEYLYMVKRGVY